MSRRPLRGMHDLRSLRSILHRSGPSEGPMAYVDMLCLMTEKTRLERELALWQANTRRIESRLADIETQMQQLEAITARDRSKGVGEAQEESASEMTLTY